jgi:predicted DsbA family dithiol-disulfide isomerase
MIVVDVVQDVICPWCRIGEHHLDTALAEWKGEPVEVRLHAFQLAPEVPPEGADYRQHLLRKFGDPSRLDAIHQHLDQIAKPLGVVFHQDRIHRLPYTLRAHAMIASVPRDRQRPLLHALQRAYFEEGLDVGSPAVLAQVGESIGLSPEDARHAAVDGDIEAAREDAREMAEAGISGVPSFIFDGRYLITGAQQPQVLLQVLQRVAADRGAAAARA